MRYVALVRGINVGGQKKIGMGELRELLSSLGYGEVSTYLQSGNALFTAAREEPGMAREIEGRIASDLGLAVKVVIRTREELAVVVSGNPFATAAATPTLLHACFLSARPQEVRLAEIDPSRFDPDKLQVGDRVIYLWYPNGVHGSKLTNAFLERWLGVSATTRNWNTVTTLLERM